MELLQIIESSIFLFSLFGIFLLLVSFASYRMKKTNNKLILQAVPRSSQSADRTDLSRITSLENIKFSESNSLLTNRFIVLNENPIINNNERKGIVSVKNSEIDIQSEEYNRLRPAKFYSLDDLK